MYQTAWIREVPLHVHCEYMYYFNIIHRNRILIIDIRLVSIKCACITTNEVNIVANKLHNVSMRTVYLSDLQKIFNCYTVVIAA